MKKISILLTGLAFSVGFGQISLTEVSNQSSIATTTDGTNAVLIDQPADGTSGIVSCNFIDLAGTVYSADDFELSMNTRVTKISAAGFNNDMTFMNNTTGVSFYIIVDEDWYPAGSDPSVDALYKFDLNIGDAGLVIDNPSNGTYILTLDLEALEEEVILSANTKYWLSVTPVMDNTGGAGTVRWNWYQSVSAEGTGVEAHLLDPADLFQGGFTAWTPFSDILSPAWGALAFTIEGEEATMGVSDLTAASLSVYPNPAKDVVNVSLKNADVKSISVTNLSGQTVATSKNSTVNVAALPAGVYVVKVLDSKGATHTSKVVVK